jgi:hypothetical protein
MSFDIKPSRGSERVKAWVYAILNPFIDSLRQQVDLLKVGNLSWRAYSKQCEYIRPISDLIEPNQQPNLDDFLAEHPAFEERFNQHDSALVRLERNLAEYVNRLLKTPAFLQEVARCIENYEARLPFNPSYPDLTKRRDTIPEYIAEFIVNNATTLPRHYAMYSFWKEYAEIFRQDFGDFTEPAHDNLKAETRELLGVTEQLRNDLEALRHALVGEYDIPAAPIDPMRTAVSENAAPRPR